MLPQSAQIDHVPQPSPVSDQHSPAKRNKSVTQLRNRNNVNKKQQDQHHQDPEMRVVHKDLQTKRSKSSASIHFNQSASKSNLIKIHKNSKDPKMQKAFQYLLDTNDKYLQEKLAMKVHKAKPLQQKFVIPRPKILTTYQQYFPKKQAHLDQDYKIEPQNKKQAFGLPEVKVCGNSTTKQFHNGAQNKRPEIATWREGFKLEGPIWNTTTYSNNFPNNGKFQKMIPIAVWDKAPTGLDFSGRTTHKTFFKDLSKQSHPSKAASWNNLHPYANDISPQKQTTYGNFHNLKQQSPIQSHKPTDYPLLKSTGTFKSEYQEQFLESSRFRQ